MIIIKGTGRCFCAGYDLSDPDAVALMPEIKGPDYEGVEEQSRRAIASYYRIWHLPKPVIAQAHGYCLGTGTELASFCDLFVVSEDCQIGFPPARIMGGPDIMWFPWHSVSSESNWTDFRVIFLTTNRFLTFPQKTGTALPHDFHQIMRFINSLNA